MEKTGNCQVCNQYAELNPCVGCGLLLCPKCLYGNKKEVDDARHLRPDQGIARPIGETT